MYRFFVSGEAIKEGAVTISGPDAHHIRDVLRMKAGDEIFVCTGDEWEYACSIETLTSEEVTARISDAAKSGKELPGRIVLYQCLPKGDKMETVIQKAVELGAAEIVPVLSSRCVSRPDRKKAEGKLKRWNQIAEAAAKQAKRMVVPQVAGILDFKEAVSRACNSDVCLLPYEKCENMAETRQILNAIQSGSSISVLIGPEGGFSEEEANAAEKAGFSAISLGRRILRTETAGMAVLAMLVFLLDR